MGEAPQESGPEAETSWAEAMRTGRPFRDEQGTVVYPSGKSRPQPNFQMDSFHRGLLTSSVAVAVLVGLYAVLLISSLMGEERAADAGYGSPSSGIWSVLLPVILTVVCAVLAKYPRAHNYPGELNEHNVQAQYRNSMKLMVWTSAGLSVITVGTALPWIIGVEAPVVLLIGVGIALACTVYFVGKSFSLK